MKKITKKSNLLEVVENYPGAAEILLEYDLHCVGCAFSAMDTLENAMKIHGISEKNMTKIIERLNEEVELVESGA